MLVRCLLLLLSLCRLVLPCHGQLSAPTSNPGHCDVADSLALTHKALPFAEAGSSKSLPTPSKDAAPDCYNFPKSNEGRFNGEGIYLAFSNERYYNVRCVLSHPLVLVNNSDTVLKLVAVNTDLDIVPQAINAQGTWQDIGEHPWDWCGNSYHTVLLAPGEYWLFKAPVYKGSFKTQLRYALYLKGKAIAVSAPHPARIDLGQFSGSQ